MSLDPLVQQQLVATGLELQEAPLRPAEKRQLEYSLRKAASPAVQEQLLRRLNRGVALNQALLAAVTDPSYQHLPLSAQREALQAAIARLTGGV